MRPTDQAYTESSDLESPFFKSFECRPRKVGRMIRFRLFDDIDSAGKLLEHFPSGKLFHCLQAFHKAIHCRN